MLTILVDTREQQPLSWPEHLVKTIRRKLNYGDYALDGEIFAVERKTVDDFVGTITKTERWQRFQRELNRMESAGCPKIIVVEGSYSQISLKEYSAGVNPVFWGCAVGVLAIIIYRKRQRKKLDDKNSSK